MTLGVAAIYRGWGRYAYFIEPCRNGRDSRDRYFALVKPARHQVPRGGRSLCTSGKRSCPRSLHLMG